jgi:glycosyltransferase involved in cell wall biosynthesis
MYGEKPELLVIASHPIQYTSPIYVELSRSNRFNVDVLYLTVPDSNSQSLGFNHAFEWDIPLFEGYSFKSCKSVSGGGLRKGFFGVRLNRPLAEIRTVIKDKRPDAVLLTGWHFFGLVQVFFFLRKWNIPLLLRMDSNDLKKRSFLATLFYRWYARHISIGLAVGTRNQRFLEDIGIAKEHIVRCPHVVDNHFFSEGVDARRQFHAEIRRSLGIEEDSFCFAYIGKFEQKKSPMDILSAFNDCYDMIRCTPIYLIMVGSGELAKCCREYAITRGLPVRFTGFINQSKICDMYAIADCIVLSSNEDETWGLVVNEAMACGIPAIVSTSCGCASDLIQNGQTGYTFEYKDVAHLAKLMIKVVMQRENTREMGVRAKELINTEYNIQLVGKGIEKGMAMLYGKC